MRTPPRLLLSLCAVPTLIAGVLAITPAATASSQYVTVTTSVAAVFSNGEARVVVKCLHRTKSCTGILAIRHGGKSVRFNVARKSSKYVTFIVPKAASVNPLIAGGGTGALNQKPATVVINEDTPSNVTHFEAISLELRKSTQRIHGTVSGVGPAPSDVKVTMYRVNGLKTTRIRTVEGTDFSFTVRLGVNNVPSDSYRIGVSGIVNGAHREWFYNRLGAARYPQEAQGVRGVKAHASVVDFTYGALSGNITGTNHAGGIGNGTVRVTAAPVNFPGKSGDRRELDVPNCSNEYATVKTGSDGSYAAAFLPANGQYVVQVASSLKSADTKPYMKLWNNVRGTCIGAKGAGTRVAVGTFSPVLDSSDAQISGDIDFRTTPTVSDRYVVLRTNDVNRTIVAQGHAATSGNYHFSDLAPGSYVMEYAKRTACTAWYTSRYVSNYAYHSGGDRGNERWKTVNGKYPEYNKSYQMGYVARSPVKGKKGWMFRDHCAENHAERTSNPRQIIGTTAGDSVVGVDTTLSRGATISGRVTREGGKSNKEMLVTAYRKDNRFVARTATTDGNGRFKMYGLASGNWSIMVNSDSWRGIGRSFNGQHSKSVSAGSGYTVGTLYAKF